MKSLRFVHGSFLADWIFANHSVNWFQHIGTFRTALSFPSYVSPFAFDSFYIIQDISVIPVNFLIIWLSEASILHFIQILINPMWNFG